MAKKGLDKAYSIMRFVRGNKEMTIDEAMENYTSPLFHSGIVEGQNTSHRSDSFSMPYKNKLLTGETLLNQIDEWEQQGIFVPSFAAALRSVAEKNEWIDLRGQNFVIMGAGSEIAPFKTLLNLGATVIAIDLERPVIWKNLIKTARQSSGKMIIPLRKPFDPACTDDELASIAGADLSCQGPEIRTWLLGMDQPMTIGAYAYADGAFHIRIAMAMDAVIRDLTNRRPDISIAFLLTPSDSYMVPMKCSIISKERLAGNSARHFLHSSARFLSMGSMFVPHNKRTVRSDNRTLYSLSDNIIVQQGPGYILAKNLQKWRSLVSRDQGVLVSSNVAPATTTRSVFNNKVLAAGYAGLAYFKAEAFASETTRDMMAAALINDLKNQSAAASPAVSLGHPMDLFMETANHGGFWRLAYQPRSVLAFSVCLGSLQAVKRKLKKKIIPTRSYLKQVRTGS